MAHYRAIHGIDFPHPTYDGMAVRLEPGDVSDAIPEGAVPWLVEAGHIAPCAAPAEVARPEAAALLKPAPPQAPKPPSKPAAPKAPARPRPAK